jgi:hypothetical protein
VQVDGQPEPVPAEWVETPEGKFAHSIKIPNPVPKDSGYRWTMSAKEYFDHLCKREAGEFIFSSVQDVDGFYLMRPPRRPTDHELTDRYRLEAPEMQRYFQLVRPTPAERSIAFVFSSSRKYKFVEEPAELPAKTPYVRAFGFKDRVSPNPVEEIQKLRSAYGLTWRGIRRPHDRELGIAGGEWLVVALESREVMAVMRTFGIAPRAKDVKNRVRWMNAGQCPGAKKIGTAAGNAEQLYGFLSKVLKPKNGGG